MPETIAIGPHRVGPEHPPLIVAEMSGNHGGSLARALVLIDAVAEAGAHALKLQTYTADTMTLDVDRPEFRVRAPESPWDGEKLHALYERAHTPWDWHAPIFERCRARGLTCFSSPFDASAVDLLEELDAPCHKIASFELVDAPLVRRAAETGKPLFLSTGMATMEEIDGAVDIARGAGCHELVLMRCASAYPAPPEDVGLAGIAVLSERFDVPVGLSDHTLGIGVAIGAAALGAAVIEKHVTLAREDGDVDAAFSLEPAELASLVVESERAWRARERATFGPTRAEEPFLAFRRSLWFTRDLEVGHVVETGDLQSLRPAGGLAPRHLEECLGRALAKRVARGTPVTRGVFA